MRVNPTSSEYTNSKYRSETALVMYPAAKKILFGMLFGRVALATFCFITLCFWVRYNELQ